MYFSLKEERGVFMKRFGYLLLVLMMVLLCTACGKEEEKKGSFDELKAEITAEMEAAKGGKYENLNILCDEVRLPESEEIKEMKFPGQEIQFLIHQLAKNYII